MARRSNSEDTKDLLSGLGSDFNPAQGLIGLTTSDGPQSDNGAKVQREEDAEREAERSWRQGIESTEMIDDPIRMYLREIGGVSLLKAAEERVLARQMEAQKHIEGIEKELTSPDGRPPRSWQVVIELIRGTCEAGEAAAVLSRYRGLEGERTFNEVISQPEMREVVDGDLQE